MSHRYEMLIQPADLKKHLEPVLRSNGSEVPPAGCYIAAVEFDEMGAVVAYQMLQNAIFLEGLWSRDNSSHLLRLHRMAVNYAGEKLGAQRVMTMTRQDDGGNRIGKLAEMLGFEQMKWNVFRRKL